MSTTAASPHGTVATPAPPPRHRRAYARWRSFAILVGVLIAAATVSAVGGVLEVFARDVWFDNLSTPSWALSTRAITTVSCAVYLAMGLAGWRIWVRAPGSIVVSLWVVQLGLGIGWTALFFGLWLPRVALLEALVLLVVACATVVAAWPRTRTGAWLLVPFVAWTGYLLALNAAIVRLN